MPKYLRYSDFWWLVCLFLLWTGAGIGLSARAQTIEICNNGIDDDGDRLVDCQDPDCPECARFINCVEPNTCYMPPTWAVPVSPTALSDVNDKVYGAQDLVLSTNAEVTTVTIRTSDGSFTKTVVVTSTGSTIVQLPLSVVMSNSPNTIQRNKGLIIQSGEPVQVTYRQTPGLNQDIVPLKCRAALGYAFYAGSQTRLTTTNVPNERHFVSVMATQPNTVVTFRSPVLLDGVSTFPFSVTLQAGDSYMLASRLINAGANSANESVSGVLVTSTQPIVVNSGSQHTAQPYSGNRDAGIDQLVPVRITGTNYVAMHSQNTTANADYVIVVGTENGTSVSVSGPSAISGTAGVLSTTTINAGQVFTYNLPNVPNRAYTITTGKRAYVYHVSSYAANEFGMGILPTINPCNGSKRIDFYRTTASSNDQAVVTIPTAGLASMTFRGAVYSTYGTVVDNITIGGIAHSIVSFPNGSIATAGTVNTITSTERFHVGVVSNTGGASTGNFGFYSNYEAKVDVLNPITKQPDDFYTVAEVTTGVATPHCLTLTSCGTNDRITNIVNGTFTQGTSFTGACLIYTMKTSAPKCARDTIRVQVENDIGRQGIICLEFVNIDNNLISRIIPESPVVCQPGGSTSLTIIAEQVDMASGITYTYQTITPDKQIVSTSIVSGTATGQYRISVTDSNNCRDTTSIFARPETATIAFGTGPTTACAGSTVTYTVNSTSGTYGWTVTGATILSGGTPGSNSITVRWNSTGSLKTTVTSSNGCTAVVTRAITILAAPTLTVTTRNPLCNGTATGTVDLSVVSGTAPYSYQWSNGSGQPGATTEDLTNVVAGVYSVSVTDRYGCVPTSPPLSVTLTNATSLSLTTSQTNPLCNGDATGTASVTVSGGTSPYRYQWSTGLTMQAITGLATGSYTVTAQDANGCTLSRVVSVTQPAALSLFTARTSVGCNGASTGQISLSVSGGIPGYTYRWNDPAQSGAQNRTGLVAGTYSVTVTDANNCTATTPALITEPTALTLSAIASNAKCNGAAQGTINLTVSGGISGYAYRWDMRSDGSGATTEDITNLTAGVYSVTVTDANACTRTLSATIAQPTALSLTLIPRNSTCNGVSDGAITLTVGGGSVPQTFRWSDGGNTNSSRTGLAAGIYSVTATDANGCFITANTTLTAPAPITASAMVTDVACSSGSTGSIDLSVGGGTGGYSYTWNTGLTTQDISILPAGEYAVTIGDANGCRFDFGASVRQPRPLSVTVLTTDAPCFGGTGDITTEVRGGTEAYSYRWSNGATTATIFSLPVGTYQLVVTDANSCTAQTMATVSSPPNFAINAVVVPVSCNSGANASIDVTIEGGTPGTPDRPYRYRWNTGATTEDISDLPAGVYSLTVIDANNCYERVDINVQEPPLMTLSESHTNVSCFSGTNGAINLTVSGGTQPNSFLWNDAVTTEDRTTLPAGTYRVVVTDKNSCSAALSITLTQPTALSVVPSVTAVSCNGGNDGAIALGVSGGVGPYQYQWARPDGSVGNTSLLLSGLMTGIYAVTVTDTNSCSITVLNRVSEPTGLTVSTLQQSVLCNNGNNGSITVAVSGGSPGYIFRWNDGSTSQNRTSLSAGIYSLTVLDANNCSQVKTFTLTQPTALSLAGTVQDVACSGGNTGAISLAISGGVAPYDVLWSNGNTTPNRTGLSAGTYSVTVTDANGCVISRMFSVTQPTPLVASGSVRNVSCADGSDGTISLTVSGGVAGYGFIWSAQSNGSFQNPSGQNQTGLSAGLYTVVIRDANGCETSRSFSITQPDLLRVSSRVSPVSCNRGSDGAIALDVSGGTPGYRYQWSSGRSDGSATTPTVNGLLAGTYSVTVTDAQQCSVVVSVDVPEPGLITMIARPTATQCNGSSDGTISLTVAGGVAPYGYQWSRENGQPVATTEGIAGVVAGNYVVTVTDFNNCPASMTIVVAQPNALTMNLLAQHNLCYGDISGAINLTASGGTGPYNYLWNNGFPDRNIGDLITGSYAVVVTDANGCTATGGISLTSSPRLTTSFSATNVSCFGGTNGAIDLTVSGGVSPYSYTWVDGYETIGPIVQDRTNLPANTYTATIRDQNGCQTSEVVNIIEPAALSLTGSFTAVSCNAGNSGAVSVTALGGTPGTPERPYSYQWNDGILTANRTGLVAGTYSVTVTDANNCQKTLSLTLSEPTALSLASSVENVSCDGGNNGAASLTVAGGVSPYTYQWSNGSTAQNLTNLPKGNYSVVVTDAHGCTISASVAVSQPLPLTASVLGTDAICNGQTGTITTEVRGGTPEYSYRWNTGATTATINSLPVGSYTLVVTDANGCQSSATTSITQPQPFNLNAVVVPVSCQAGANGSIDLTAEGSTAPYRYRWSNGATTQDVSGLISGIYSVTVLDVNDCLESTTINVSQPGSLSVELSSQNLTCFGNETGQISLTASGGTTPYRYVWIDPAQSGAGSGTASVASTPTRTGLESGLYSVRVSDGNGCSEVRSVSLSQPTALSLTGSVTAVACNGGATGAVSVTVLGGTPTYLYQWNTGATTAQISSLTTGLYSVTATDANGCFTTLSLSVAQPTALSLVGSATAVACNGGATGAVSATALGGVPGTPDRPYDYQWNTGAATASINSLTAGVYLVTATDANACFTTLSLTVVQPMGLSLTSSTTAVSCNGNSTGAITASVSGGVLPYQYQWNTGAVTASLNNLSAGIYSLTATDANACFIVRSFTVSQPTALSLSSTFIPVACNGASTGEISLSVSGGTQPYSYAWNDGILTANRTGLVAGTYSLTATDANGCLISTSVVISEPTALSLASSVQNVSCDGGSNGAARLTVSGGISPYRYQWNTGATTQNLTNLPKGNYSVTVTDANGCTIAASVAVSQPLPLTASVLGTDAICNGQTGTITTEVRGGTPIYQYRWNNGATTSTINGLPVGSYTLTVTDANGCTASATTSITQPQPFNLNAVVVPVSCQAGANGSIDLTAEGSTAPYRYRWSTGATTQDVSGLVSGIYSVTVLDVNDCLESTTINVSQPGSLSVELSSQNLTCFGNETGQISLTASGGTTPYRYVWIDPAQSGAGSGTASLASTPTRTGLSSGLYSVTVSDSNGCSEVRSVSLSQPTALSLSSTSINVACNGASTGEISLSVSGGTVLYNYAWNDGVLTANRTGLEAGIYSVTATDGNGCFISTSITVSEPPALSLASSVQNVSCDGGTNGAASLTVAGGVSPYTYQWNTGATSQNLSNLPKGNYSVIVTDANGCTIAASVAVSQPLPLTASVLGTDAICNGQFGTITTEVRGGTPEYSYRWNTGATTATINGLPVGSYTLVVTDANGCQSSTTTSVTQPQPFNLNAVVVPVSCQGGANGSIDLTVEGSTPPYRYRWSNRDGEPGATTEDVSELVAGIYSVTVLDANNCVESTTINVGQPGGLSVSLSSRNLTCFTNDTGQISLTATGGFGPYTYQWADNGTVSPASTSARTGLSAGAYSVTVLDGNNCSVMESVTINQPTALSIASTSMNIAINGANTGSISLTVSGGTSNGLYAYRWNDGAATADRFSLAAGTYSVTATDANGCFTSTTVTLSEPTALTLTIDYGNVSCNGGMDGSTSLTVAGGIEPYSYQWSNGNGQPGATTQSLTNVGAGNYDVIVTDANGATAIAGVAISQPRPLLVSALPTNAVCNGQTGTTTTEVRGGTPTYSYLWNTGNTMASVFSLSVGSYTLVVTDANGCTASTGVTINQPQPFNLNAIVKPVSCRGGANGSINLTVEGATPGYRILWSTGRSDGSATTEDVDALTAGTYSVTVLDANNCAESTTIVVQEPPSLSVALINHNPSCFGGTNGSVSLTATGGSDPYTYVWADNGTTSLASTDSRTGLMAGIYSVTVLDANGCSEARSATLAEGGRPYVQLAAVPSELSGATPRNNGQLILSGFAPTDRFDVSLGSVYSGSAIAPGSLPVVPPNGVLTQLLPNPNEPQPYTVRVFDPTGCYTDVTVILMPTIFNCPPEPACVPILIRKNRG